MCIRDRGRTEFVLEATSRTAFRQNNWVMIPPYKGSPFNESVNIEVGNSKKYLLFNLDTDISQEYDLSDEYPEKLKEMIKRYGEITGDELGEVEELILE